MKIPESKTKWIAGLSDGTTVFEGKGIASKVAGEDSPWLKLQKHLKDNSLSINSLNIWIGDRHYNLPSNKPKFGGLVPNGYNFFRRFASDVMAGEENVEHYICIEAIYDSFKVQTYVDEIDNNKSWINIVEVADGKD
jgi:hypothetical protein